MPSVHTLEMLVDGPAIINAIRVCQRQPPVSRRELQPVWEQTPVEEKAEIVQQYEDYYWRKA